MNKILLGGYIAFWVSFAAASVGDTPDIPLEPYTIELPFLMLGILLPPAILGFLIGRYD